MKRARRLWHCNGSTDQPAVDALIRAVVAGCGSPARALEICYWSREPGLIEIIRAIVSMPEKTRAAIEAFIVLSGDCATVTAGLDHHGTLTLASAEAAKIAALAHYAAAHDVEDTHRLLN